MHIWKDDPSIPVVTAGGFVASEGTGTRPVCPIV